MPIHGSLGRLEIPGSDIYSCCSKLLQTGWLKQQKSILSKFWRSEVWNQGVSMALFTLEALEKKHFWHLLVAVDISWCSMAHGCFISVLASLPFPLWFCVPKISHFLSHKMYMMSFMVYLLIHDSLFLSRSLTYVSQSQKLCFKFSRFGWNFRYCL